VREPQPLKISELIEFFRERFQIVAEEVKKSKRFTGSDF
jgi:hypothetical protein